MRIKTTKPKRKEFPSTKRRYPVVRDARRYTAIDPGFCMAIAHYEKRYKQLLIVQAAFPRKTREKLPDLGAAVADHAHHLAAFLGVAHGDWADGKTMVLQEYPIPFYRASRESIASVNFIAGITFACLNAQGAQFFTPGPSKDLPDWNHRGEGKERAAKFLQDANLIWVDACNRPGFTRAGMATTNLERYAKDDPSFLLKDTKGKKPTDDAVSAVGLLLVGLDYNEVILPADVRVYIGEFTYDQD